jgi:hypothetical protein
MVSAALIICSSVCVSQQTSSTTNVLTGWQKINASGVFTFCLPKSAWDTGFVGIDESYKEYRIGKLRFMFVYEPMGILSYDRREQKFGKGYQEQVVEIAGRKAYLFTYVQNMRGRKRHYTDLYFGDFPNGDVELWMQADSWRRNDLEIVKKIFGTLEFLQAQGTPKAFNQHLVSMGQPCALSFQK